MPCQQWLVQGPQKHIITPSTYVEDLKDSSVFCRNPGGLGERPWCYTTDPQTRWEHCNIPKCETCDQYSGSFCSGFESMLERAYTQLITQSSLSLSSGCNTLLHMFLCQIGQLVSAVPGASLQCSESRKSNPGCFPLPQWDQFGAMPAESKVDCYELL
ncbi:hypothetical protein EMCRGX_G010847 [Ephydatia muelleri]